MKQCFDVMNSKFEFLCFVYLCLQEVAQLNNLHFKDLFEFWEFYKNRNSDANEHLVEEFRHKSFF